MGVCYGECVHITSIGFDSLMPPKAIFHSRWEFKRLKYVEDKKPNTTHSASLSSFII